MTLVREATADDMGLHERASATPAHLKQTRARAPKGIVGTLPDVLDLRAAQECFAAFVSSPEENAPSLDADSVAKLLTGGPRLTPTERLEIYRRGYHARLIECLTDDYPILRHALGAEAFESLCRKYIAEHPSTSPSLNAFGERLATFAARTEMPHAAFATDLARLEWAVVTAIHARTSGTLDPTALAQIPSERWPSARLLPNPSVQFLRLAHPANAYLHAVRHGESPAIPSPSPTAVAVYRTGRSVWRLELLPAMVVLFEALVSGETLEASLDGVEPMLSDMTPDEAGAAVMAWFREGVSSGMFAGVSAEG